ncbi:MAG: peptidase T [Candidatus Thermoplasmatota archaeon]|jgi:tripeptide aminopeptidase|nr:peptidase T [Candidatus Thermoplasmatota archaeon]
MSDVVERFVRYAKVWTTSEEGIEDRYPSTERQKDLLRLLVSELKKIGLKDAAMDKHGYVMATLPSNLPKKKKVPVIGLIAHVDTSPEVSGKGVRPILHKNYDGKDIVLPGDPTVIIKVDENPHLSENVGGTIITSDGTTLLGADDKAGVAAIMSALAIMVKDDTMKHGDVRIAFTPDEEVGNGTKFFDVKAFGADIGYTMDGGQLGEVEDETFNAMSATFTVKGINYHPGYAKGRMVNAIRIITEIANLVPATISPETTERREGYLHPHKISGSVEEASLQLLIRDFTMEGIGEKVAVLESVAELQRAKYPKATIDLDIKESYRNMKYKLDEEPRALEYSLEAVKRAGVEPIKAIVRGGTDGSRLSYMGLPTPNIFAGGMNFHSKLEYVPAASLEASVRTIIELLKLYAEKC